jgi:hypothetical protein
MLAARNRRFRVAAGAAAVAWLLLAVLETIEAVHVLRQDGAPGGYVVSAVLFVGVHAVGMCGWAIAASAFGREIDWARLRLGGTIVATTYLGYFVAWMVRLLAALANVHVADYRDYYIWSTVGVLILAAGSFIVVTGFTDARRGEPRARRLFLGAIASAAASLATTVAALYLRASFAGAHAVDEATTSALLDAIGSFGTALAALFFALGARRPFAAREARLAGAAVGASAAALCIAGGEALLAVAYGRPGGLVWQQVVAWLAVASRLCLVAAPAAVALGAFRASAADR